MIAFAALLLAGAPVPSTVFEARCAGANYASACRCAAERLQQTSEGRFFLETGELLALPPGEREPAADALLARYAIKPDEAAAFAERARAASEAALSACR